MRKSLFLFVAVIVAAVASTAQAEDAVYTVARSVPIAETSGASRGVRASCTLDTRLPGFIENYARKGVKVVMSDEPLDSLEGKVLHLEIVQVLGAAGGGWSGPKTVTVEGELTENGDVIGSFTATRFSTGGWYGQYKSTCSILGRCIKAIGKDIAAWLRNPTKDALLGDA